MKTENVCRLFKNACYHIGVNENPSGNFDYFKKSSNNGLLTCYRFSKSCIPTKK